VHVLVRVEVGGQPPEEPAEAPDLVVDLRATASWSAGSTTV
jgi:hypothetical protein